MIPRGAFAIAVGATLALSACAGPPVSVASNTYPSVPNGFAETVNMISAEPIAVWVHGHTILAVVTVGSELCPPVPTAISASDSSTVELIYVTSPNTPCSGSIGPTTNEFKIPDGLDIDSNVTVNIRFEFDTPQSYSVEVKD